MKIKTLCFLSAGILLLTHFTGCRKNAPEGNMFSGKVALSFDDTYIDNWYSYLDLLDSLNIKATFYISRYHILNASQKDKLRTIQAHGNEIGYHTTNHPDLVKMYTKNCMRDVVNNEIKPDLALMRNDGFNPENFAFPYGQHDGSLDRQLLVYFKSVRAVCTPKNYYRSFVKGPGDEKVYHAAYIDSRAKISEDKIEELMQTAHDNRSCVLLYGHAINSPSLSNQVNADRLRFVASMAKKYNLEFVTIADMTN